MYFSSHITHLLVHDKALCSSALESECWVFYPTMYKTRSFMKNNFLIGADLKMVSSLGRNMNDTIFHMKYIYIFPGWIISRFCFVINFIPTIIYALILLY